MSSETSLMREEAWRGILPIVSVPFHADEAVDYGGFVDTLRYIDKTRCTAMVLFGIASEFYKLCDEEKTTLVEAFVTHQTSKQRVISITDHASHLAVKKAVQYQSMGCDALMLLPPFFLKPSKKEIMRHIRAVLEAVSLPVIVQIAPNETGTTYEVHEIISLCKEFPHCMLKIEGSPIPDAFIKALRNAEKRLRIFNGYAGIYMPQMLAMGCAGIMPGCSFIELYTTIYELYERGDIDAAQGLHAKFVPYGKTWMSSCEYIIKVEKYILMKRGVIQSDTCRSPSYDLAAHDYEDVEVFLKTCELL